MGFNIGWSYWLCQIFGNVGYAVITMDAFNYFFPGVFTGGNNLYSIIGGSFLIWFFNFLVLRGVKQATLINLVVTIAKIVPLVLFIIIVGAVFNMDKFDFDFWGDMASDKLGNVGSQIKNTMLVTLWAFIGIEMGLSCYPAAPKNNPMSVGQHWSDTWDAWRFTSCYPSCRSAICLVPNWPVLPTLPQLVF